MNKMKERQARMMQLLKKLKELYPKPAMALHYTNDWELLVAIILSAQCTDKKVNEVTASLFKKYKAMEDYAAADLNEFGQDIRQTGFYRSKAKNIIASAKLLMEHYHGRIPCEMDQLLALPGVARKTANVYMAQACGKAEGIAVDTHVRRFVYRFDLSDSIDPKRIEQDLMRITPQDEWAHLTLRFIDYGRDYCPARKHDCDNHPLTLIWPEAASRWIWSDGRKNH